MFNNSTLNSIELNTSSSNEKSSFKGILDTISNVEVISKNVIKKFVFDSLSNIDTILKKVGKMGNDAISLLAKLNRNTIKKFVNDSLSNIDGLVKKITIKYAKDFITNIEHTLKET